MFTFVSYYFPWLRCRYDTFLFWVGSDFYHRYWRLLFFRVDHLYYVNSPPWKLFHGRRKSCNIDMVILLCEFFDLIFYLVLVISITNPILHLPQLKDRRSLPRKINTFSEGDGSNSEIKIFRKFFHFFLFVCRYFLHINYWVVPPIHSPWSITFLKPS